MFIFEWILGFLTAGIMGIEEGSDDLFKEVSSGLGVEEEVEPGEEAEVVEDKPEEKPEEKVEDDPELDLGLEKKYKRSILKELISKGEDYTKKTQELSSQRAELKPLEDFMRMLRGDKRAANAVIALTNIIEDPKADKNLLDKVINILSAKAEKIEETKDDVEDMLKELDVNDPAYIHLKNQYKMLKDLSGKIDSMANGLKRREEELSLEKKQGQIKTATEVLTNTLNSLKEEFKIDDDTFGYWKKLVLADLKDNPQSYNTKEDFIRAIKSVGKVHFDDISKLLDKKGEAKLANFIKSQSGKIPASSEAKPGKEEKKVNLGSFAEGVETIESLLRDEEAKREAK